MGKRPIGLAAEKAEGRQLLGKVENNEPTA